MKNFSLAFFPAKANTSQFTDLLSVVTGRHLDDRDGDDLRSFRQRLAVAGILFQIVQAAVLLPASVAAMIHPAPEEKFGL